MANKRKKPEIRFAGYETEWIEKKFDETFDILSNNTLSRDALNYDDGVAKNVHYGDVLVKFGEYLDVNREQLPYISDANVALKFIKSYLKDGDIVIADTAEDESVGKCTEIIGIKDTPIISGLHTIPCRPKQNYAPKYMGYYLNSKAYHDKLLPLMQGIKVTSISKTGIKDTDVILSSEYDEQEKIGVFLSSLDDMITLETSKYEKLLIIKKAMLENMFPKEGCNVPEIRFKGFNDVWENRKLSELLFPADERNNSGKYTQDDILAASLGTELVKKHIFFGLRSTEESVKNYRVVNSGDVIYTKSPIKGYPNGIIRTNKGLDGIVPSLYCVYHSIPSINSSIIQSYFEDKGRLDAYLYPLVNIGARNNVNITDLGFLDGTICVPQDINEQNKIVAFFNHLTNLITLHRSKLDKLKSIKSACMENMFV